MQTTAQLNSALSGRYEIERHIGEGGMATVYLARDLRHHRNVALKVLKPELGVVLGPDRFLTEIEVTANLHHPNLLPLFDSGEVGGLLFYVMPYVEGETLRARLERERQLPVDEAVRIAVLVAGALDYAHRHNVIHRDLKPENILLHEGQPLVMDFGIALAVSNAGGARVTQTGLSLGTPQYMSPEQATGDRQLDARTDIYSLAAVLYEMLSGDPPHTGSTVQAVIAKVITDNPRPLRDTRATIPVHVEAALLQGLAKVPADRWASAKEFAEALTGVRPVRLPALAQERILQDATVIQKRRTRTMTFIAIGGWVAALAALVVATQPPQSSGGVTGAAWFSMTLPDSVQFAAANAGNRGFLALSRDGSQLVVAGVKDGQRSLYLHRLSAPGFQRIPGSDSAMTPSFSPDGQWLLYKIGTRLVRLPVSGGRAQRLVDSADGGSWGDGDVIVYTHRGSLWRMAADGSDRKLVGERVSPGAVGYLSASVLPGGQHALVTMATPPIRLDSMRIAVISLRDARVKDLGIRGVGAAYVKTGQIGYLSPGSMMLAPFSLRKLAVTGPSVPLPEGIGEDANFNGMSSSDNGVFAYAGARNENILVPIHVVGRDGKESPLKFEEQSFQHVRVSPDGSRALVGIGPRVGAVIGDIWVYDFAAGTRVALSTDQSHIRAEWKDNSTIIYIHNLIDSTFLVSRPWNRSGEETVIARGGRAGFFELSVGPANGYSAIRRTGGGAAADIYIACSDSMESVLPIAASPQFVENAPRVSPNGHLLAFQSNETGANEVYVQAIPGSGPRIAVSTGGGTNPRWSSDGSTLMYVGPSRLMTAKIIETPTLALGVRDSLFVWKYGGYDPFPGERQFLVFGRVPVHAAEIQVIMNWPQLSSR